MSGSNGLQRRDLWLAMVPVLLAAVGIIWKQYENQSDMLNRLKSIEQARAVEIEERYTKKDARAEKAIEELQRRILATGIDINREDIVDLGIYMNNELFNEPLMEARCAILRGPRDEGN